MTHAVAVYLGGFNVSELCRDDAGVVVRTGRANSTEQPMPNSAVVELDNVPRIELLQVGLSLWVNVTRPGETAPERWFTGVVSDVEASVLPAGGSRHRVIATSAGLGRMANRRVGDVPWPVELDGTRVGRILELAGVEVGTVDPGTVRFDARDVDSQAALPLAQEYAAQAFGVLVDGRDGAVSYHDSAHRDPDDGPYAELGAGELLTEPRASQRVSTVTNRVRIRYGPEPQAELRVTDDESIERYGLYDKSMTTTLASVTDAEHTAATLLRLYAEPHWGSEILRLRLDTLPDARAGVLAALPANVLVTIVGSPEPLPAHWPVWVEGITDTISVDRWARDILVSDRYMAPVVEPPDPPPPGDCDVFDWPALCSTDNVFPNGGPLSVDGLWNPAAYAALAGAAPPAGFPGARWDDGGPGLAASESAVWEPDGVTMRYRVEAGSESLALYGIGPITTIGVGPADAPHPDPWLGSADPADFCIRWDGIAYSEPGRPPGEHNADWRPFLGEEPGGPITVVVVPAYSGWRWEPTNGWGEGVAYWADGAAPPFGDEDRPNRAGCNVWEYGRYSYLYPGLNRQPTQNGQWQALLFALAVADEGTELPAAFYIKLRYPIEVSVNHFRWSRARA